MVWGHLSLMVDGASKQSPVVVHCVSAWKEKHVRYEATAAKQRG